MRNGVTQRGGRLAACPTPALYRRSAPRTIGPLRMQGAAQPEGEHPPIAILRHLPVLAGACRAAGRLVATAGTAVRAGAG